MKKKIILLWIMCLIFVPAQASTLKDKKNELNTAQQNMKDKQEAVKQNKQEQQVLQDQIQAVDLKIVAVQDELKSLDEQLTIKQDELEESKEKLDVATIKKEKQYEATKARMVQMYKNQKIGYLQVVLSSHSFWDAMNRVEYIRRISQKDNHLLDEYELQIDVIEEQKVKIEAEKKELDALQQKALAKNEELESVRSEKKTAMEKLAKEQGKLQSEIESLEAVAEELTSQIKEITRKLEEEARRKEQAATSGSNSGGNKIPTQYVGGVFMWPVPGHYLVSSGYVDRTSPIFGSAEFHTGIDIPANYADDVVAAADGVVITSGWIRGYGNTVMISHGSGLVTLYGHNSSLVVSNGQSVTKGQVIAKIGSTGYSTGNHCHFEVRVNGEHTDPWPYLGK